MKQEQKSIIKIYVIAILIPLLVAAASTLLTIKNMDIYKKVSGMFTEHLNNLISVMDTYYSNI